MACIVLNYNRANGNVFTMKCSFWVFLCLSTPTIRVSHGFLERLAAALSQNAGQRKVSNVIHADVGHYSPLLDERKYKQYYIIKTKSVGRILLQRRLMKICVTNKQREHYDN